MKKINNFLLRFNIFRKIYRKYKKKKKFKKIKNKDPFIYK